jgi:Fibronectin type III domain
MRVRSAPVTMIAALLLAVPLVAAPPPPSDLTVTDRPNDAGESLVVSWKAPEVDLATIARFDVSLKAEGAGEFEKVTEAAPAATGVTLDELEPNTAYRVRVTTVGVDNSVSEPATIEEAVAPRVQWFNVSRAWLAILLAAVCGAVLGFIAAARHGLTLWVRPIAGLEAVSDAVGRAVEMGKSVLFVPGIQDINDIQTVAGITVLSRVARVAAEYDAEIKVPTGRSLVMATCRETVQAAFLSAGRPDAYNPDHIYYLTDEQFGFAAGVTGHMVRERPAACFYLGAFYAESLIFAETGSGIGSIQVAGTAEAVQLPFFIAACDYTLIGEEFFAASAYLSGEPQQLGSLKGQDVGKLLAGALIVGGCLLAPVAFVIGGATEKRGAAEVVEYLRENVLGDAGLFCREAE